MTLCNWEREDLQKLTYLQNNMCPKQSEDQLLLENLNIVYLQNILSRNTVKMDHHLQFAIFLFASRTSS